MRGPHLALRRPQRSALCTRWPDEAAAWEVRAGIRPGARGRARGVGMAELRPVAEARETDRNEAELAAVLDLLWRKLHGIHEQEITRTAARLRQASGETRAAAEALSITILRAVFARCSAALLDSDRDDERHDRARMLAELFGLRKERA